MTFRCSSSLRAWREEARTHLFDCTVAVALSLALVTGVSRAAAGEEAGAATRPPSATQGGPQSPDNLLGALSFTSGREPIAVTAKTLEFDYRARVLTYKGDVLATQGDMKLQSNALTVTLEDSAQNQLREVVATGNVRLSKGERTATAGKAIFDQTKRTVVLTENAVLRDGPNQVTGERVVVYLDEQRSVVEGGNSRVQAVLFPPKGDATPESGGSKSAAKAETP